VKRSSTGRPAGLSPDTGSKHNTRPCAIDPVVLKLGKRKNGPAGFTLFETLAVLAICAFVAAGVCLGVTQAMNDSKGRECAANLATLEGAKDEFSRDNPGAALTSLDQLKPYLKYGVPTCPAGGTYENIISAGEQCTCSLGTSSKPGFHSLAQP
jgi:type II secretory pathway pseudopilin PulG